MPANVRALRCSSLPMFFACSHSQDQMPLLIEAHNDAADLGTAVHDAMRSIVQGIPVDVRLVALRHAVDEKELGPLVAYGRKAWAELASSFPRPKTEVDVELDRLVYHLTGHVDLLSVVEGAARFLDWKSGRKESNDYFAQLAGYALCLILGQGYKSATGTVVWLRSQTVETFRFEHVDASTFDAKIADQLSVVRYSHGEHCAFCPRSHDCPALVAISRRDVAIFSQADVDALVAQAPAQEVVSMRRRSKVLEAFMKSFDTAVRRRIVAEGPLDSGDGNDLALVEENGKRDIKPAKAWPIVQPLLEEMDDDELGEVLSISAAGLDEVVAKKAGKGKGAAAKRALEAELKQAGALTQPKVTKLKEVRRELPAEENAHE
jgi:hypothetical protein